MQRTPAYLVVYNALREGISGGSYPPGSLLPPEPELERLFGVSRTTVRRAVGLLADEGQVRVKQGFGTQVLFDHTDASRYRKFHNVITVRDWFRDENLATTPHSLHIDHVKAPDEVVRALRLAPGSSVFRVQRITQLGSDPFSFMINHFRDDLLPGFDQRSYRSINMYQILEDVYGIYFKSAEEFVSAVLADFIDARMLNVEIGAPLLCCKRTSVFENIGLFEYTVTKLRPDLYNLQLQMEGATDYYRSGGS